MNSTQPNNEAPNNRNMTRKRRQTPAEHAAVQRNFEKFAKQSLAYDPATNTSHLTNLGRNRISGKPYPKNKPNISGKGYLQYLVRGYLVGKWVDISRNAEPSVSPLSDELSVKVRIDGKNMWLKPEDMQLYDIHGREVIGNVNMNSVPVNSKSVMVHRNGENVWVKPENKVGGRRSKTQRKRK
jgi:hypothetical protein